MYEESKFFTHTKVSVFICRSKVKYNNIEWWFLFLDFFQQNISISKMSEISHSNFIIFNFSFISIILKIGDTWNKLYCICSTPYNYNYLWYFLHMECYFCMSVWCKQKKEGGGVRTKHIWSIQCEKYHGITEYYMFIFSDIKPLSGKRLW